MRTPCLLLVAALAGCASAPPPPPDAPRLALPGPAGPRGSVAFRAVADPSSRAPELTAHQEFVRPQPTGVLASPAYPEEALVARETGVCGVRITIGPEGRVTTVEDSPVVASSPGAFAVSFRAAVEAAVRRWQFTRPQVDDLQDGNDLDGDGTPDYVRVLRSTPVAVFYDLRFEFTLQDGKPVVRGGL